MRKWKRQLRKANSYTDKPSKLTSYQIQEGGQCLRPTEMLLTKVFRIAKVLTERSWSSHSPEEDLLSGIFSVSLNGIEGFNQCLHETTRKKYFDKYAQHWDNEVDPREVAEFLRWKEQLPL